MKVVVVGCTHAGTSVVKNMLEKYDDVEVTVFERNDNVSFLSCGIALYVGGVVKNSQDLFYSTPQELSDLGATLHMEHDVTNIDVENKVITATDLTTGNVVTSSYDKLVMTTGSWPIIPPIKGKELENVLLCKNYRQAQEIIAKASPARKIVVVGGGYIGIELVEAFVESGKEVTLIDGLDRILNKYLDAGHTKVLEQTLKDKLVHLALNESVTEFISDEQGKLIGVKTNQGNYEADLAILCVGFKPQTELLKNKVNMLDSGAIIVDEYMMTSEPDIFSAGDSTVVYYNPTDSYQYIPLATNAIRQGMIVAENIKKKSLAYRGTQGTSGLYLFGWTIGSTGMTLGSALAQGIDAKSTWLEDNYRPEFMPTTEKVLMQLVYHNETKIILGAQLMSKYDITQSANTLSVMIQNKMTVEDLALQDFFFQPHFDRPWNYLNLLALKALREHTN